MKNFQNINSISRRKFIKSLKILLWGLFSYFLVKITKNEKKRQSNLEISNSEFEYKNLFIKDDIIIVNNDSNLKVFLNKCTHLGCKLLIKDNELHCPCHGSKFNLDGTPIKGPAMNKLTELDYHINKSHIIVQRIID